MLHRVAIYNYDNGNMEDNDVTDDWYHNNHYDGNWHHSDQTQLHSNQQQLALQHGNEQMPFIVSGLEEVIIATATVRKQQVYRSHDRQWCSYTCLPTMVCNRVTNTTTDTRIRTTAGQ